MKRIVAGVLSLAPLQGRGGAEDSRGTVPGRWMEQVEIFTLMRVFPSFSDGGKRAGELRNIKTTVYTIINNKKYNLNLVWVLVCSLKYSSLLNFLS